MSIEWSRWKRYLLPDEEQRDAALHEELTRVAVVGLRAVVYIAVAAPAYMLAVTMILSKLRYLSDVWVWPDITLMATGLVGIPFIIRPGLQSHARLAGCAMGFVVMLIFHVTAVTMSYPGVQHMMTENIVLVMLVAIAALPLRPLQTLALGSSICITHVAAMALFPDRLFVPDVSPLRLVALVAFMLIFVGLTAVIYHQRASAFQARQEVLGAQAQLALAESSAAQGRLAAAMSHELNSPIAVIASNSQTLAGCLEKLRAGTLSSERLVTVLGGVEGAVRSACERLAEIVGRMQRFTHLDRAEEATIDVSSLLKDAVETLRSGLEDRVDVILELEPLPALRCRPQQLSAVFANLLLNARNAVAENGAIHVRSTAHHDEIAIEVEDNGCGIPAERLVHIFEPSFAVARGRVSTGNWGLFNCRRIIHALGGEIRIKSAERVGTTVEITLPVDRR